MSESQAFAIEVHGHAAGIVVAGRDGFTFFASDTAFMGLDRRVFRHVSQAERAAQEVMAARRRMRGDRD